MMTWVLEHGVFGDGHQRLAAAVTDAGGQVLDWDDAWLSAQGPHHALQSRSDCIPRAGNVSAKPPKVGETWVIFHGSLGNAALINDVMGWTPGAWCAVERLRCSAWYHAAQPWLVHERWLKTTVRRLVDAPEQVLGEIVSGPRFFVRPDSPLKPFSGRTLARDGVSLRALDYGFYYDDVDLPIIVAPSREVGAEWRFVIVEGEVIAGCAYQADGRAEAERLTGGEPWQVAQEIAGCLPPPDPVYVLDLCAVQGQLRLLELNPFSGADLYACDRVAIVEAVEALLRRSAR
ncbi:ATP-grasp domain-containing protein [Myxococcota bacterium]|nr:ATP-grasp domain-containing protein [Myxococcota bacterium]MBU1430088.1 ATP-grasp domain-containing protein [Myxococcota bacterium]MBU1899543.1 ATP-grasp domain-containing protein [Myxococcota bacterium]